MSSLNQNIIIQVNAPGAQVAINQIQQALNGSANAAKNVGTQFAIANKAIDLMTNALTSFAGAVNKAIDDAALFQVQIAQIRTIAQDQGVTFNEWSDAILRLSTEFGKPAADVAAAAYEVVSDQVAKGAQNFQVLTEAVKLSKIGVTSATAAVGALDGALTSFNLSNSEANRVASVLFKTVELGRGKISDLSNTIGRVGGVASGLGVSLEEVGAAIATITVKGTKTSDAITLLTNILLKLNKPTEEMKLVFKELGVESGQVAIATFGLGGFLSKLAEIVGNNKGKFADLGGELRAIKGFLALAGDGANAFNDNLQKISSGQTSYNNALKEFDVPGAAYLKAINAIKTAFLDLGSSIQNLLGSNNFLLNRFAGGLRTIAEAVKGFSREAETEILRLLEQKLKPKIDIEEPTKSFQNQVDKIKEGTLKSFAAITIKATESVNAANFGLKVASEATKLSVIGVIDTINERVKELNSIIGEAKSISKGISPFIGGLREGVRESDFRNRISLAEDTSTKLRVIESELFRTRQQFQKAIERGDKEGFEAAQSAAKKELDLLGQRSAANIEILKQQRLQQAAQSGETGKIRINVNSEVDRLLKEQLATVERQEQAFNRLNGLAQQRAEKAKQELLQEELKKKALDILIRDTDKFSALDSEGKIKNTVKVLKDGKFDPEGTIKKALSDLDAFQKKAIDALKAAGADTATVDQFKTLFGFEQQREALAKQINAAITRDKIENLKLEAVAQFDNIKKFREEINKLQTDSQATQVEAINRIGASLQSVDRKFQGAKFDRTRFDEAKKAFDDVNKVLKEASDARDKFIKGKGTEEDFKAFLDKLKEIEPALQKAKDSGVKFDEVLTQAGGKKLTITDAIKNAKDEAERITESFNKQKTAQIGLEESQRSIEALQKLAAQHGVTIKDNVSQAATSAEQLKGNTVLYEQALSRALTQLDAISKKYDEINLKALQAPTPAGTIVEGEHYGGLIKGFASGGIAMDSRDTVPAMLTPGEFVINADRTKEFFPLLQAINTGMIRAPKGFAGGGQVTNVGDINITAQGNNSDETLRDVGRKLRRELKRGTISFNT